MAQSEVSGCEGCPFMKMLDTDIQIMKNSRDRACAFRDEVAQDPDLQTGTYSNNDDLARIAQDESVEAVKLYDGVIEDMVGIRATYSAECPTHAPIQEEIAGYMIRTCANDDAFLNYMLVTEQLRMEEQG